MPSRAFFIWQWASALRGIKTWESQACVEGSASFVETAAWWKFGHQHCYCFGCIFEWTGKKWLLEHDESPELVTFKVDPIHEICKPELGTPAETIGNPLGPKSTFVTASWLVSSLGQRVLTGPQ